MTIASDLFRTVTVKINDISQQLPYIVVNQADDNGKIIRFVPMDHGQKVTGFTGARLYYPPRSDDQYGDYVTGVEADGAWDFTIPVGVLSVGRVGCNLSFIDGNGETYSRNVVFLVEPAVSGVFDPEDGQQTRIDKIIGTVQDTADTAIGSINKTASDAVENIGKAEQSINESVTAARGSADAAANSEQQAAASASAAQTSERNAANSAMQASQSATSANQSETNAAESERNAASSAEQAANVVASVSGSVSQAENAARSASQSATAAAGSASVPVGMLKLLHRVLRMLRRPLLPRRRRRRAPRPRLPPRRFPRRMRPLPPLPPRMPWAVSVWRSVRRPRVNREVMRRLRFRSRVRSIQRTSLSRGAIRENRQPLYMITP